MVDNSSSSDIKKALQLRYSFNWNQELSRLMGVFSFFYTNARHYRALWNLNSAILHVDRDPQHRVFALDPTKNPPVLDTENKARFEALKAEFDSLYGSGPSKDGKFSYLDLKPRERVDPSKNYVIIPRSVSMEWAWSGFTDRYLIEVIGFAYKERGFHPALGHYEQNVPMFDFNDHSVDHITNCIPYKTWESQTRKVLNLLAPVVKDIELLIASYLQREGYEYAPAGGKLQIDAETKTEKLEDDGETEAETDDAYD